MVLLDGGHEDLEVVGELRRQDSLWQIVGGRQRAELRVRVDICAVLVPEAGNPYDSSAIGVWIEGVQVGYLSRENAARYRPGLFALQQKHGQPIALPGVITGGGLRDDGPGRLGVFLNHDPEDFGLQRSVPDWTGVAQVDARLRAALGDELANDMGCSYNLTWMHDLESNETRAIPALRKALVTETDPVGRHFIFAELEAALYRCRDVFESALTEYDEACRRHDAEMDQIRPACMAQWGKVPVLDLYRQMAIRQQKLHDYAQARWWAERGLAIYAGDAARPEAVSDLRQRTARYREKADR
jgi:hypothetical protein